MKNTLGLAIALGMAGSAYGSILVNGGFEQPGTGAWAHFLNGQVPGWSTDSGDMIEIGMAAVYGVSSGEGRNMLELDSNRNVRVSQGITLAGGLFDLSFLFARRGTNMQGRTADTCDFQVAWDGQSLGTFRPAGTDMTRMHFLVTGITGKNSVLFAGLGSSDSYGAVIDDVRLESVPEPVTSSLLGVGLLAQARRRARTKSAE